MLKYKHTSPLLNFDIYNMHHLLKLCLTYKRVSPLLNFVKKNQHEIISGVRHNLKMKSQ
jgi:hypothetical protein